MTIVIAHRHEVGRYVRRKENLVVRVAGAGDTAYDNMKYGNEIRESRWMRA